MGRPKALLPWWGRPLIEHMVSRLGEIADEIAVVSSLSLSLPELPARIVIDRAPGLGPLGGIREGLHAVTADLAFVTCTDLPFVEPSFAQALLALESTAACEVENWIQPFPAVYSRDLAAAADNLIALGKMRPLHLLEAGAFRRVDGATWNERGVFDGFNTPEQYLEAVAGDERPVRIEVKGIDEDREVETAAGMLGDVLRAAELGKLLRDDGSLTPHAALSLGGSPVAGNLTLPIGPGEQLLVVHEE